MPEEWIYLLMTDHISEQLQKIIPAPRLMVNTSLAPYTTFKIGGPADYLILPANVEEVVGVLQLARRQNLPVTVLGNGSNVLVLDKGVRGIVLRFGSDMAALRHNGTTVIAGSGALLKDVSQYAADLGLAGLEFSIGIPGSIGGAVFMNAGAYDGEMSNVVTAVTAACPDGTLQRFTAAETGFSYRHSVFQDNHCTICEVELTLERGDLSLIRGKMGDFTTKRETKQPLEIPSAGSTFKRPPGNYAGTLIEQTGLKGFRIGGAQVSLKHAGFVVNAGGATAKDVLALIGEVQKQVFEKHGVMLHPEVRTLGEG